MNVMDCWQYKNRKSISITITTLTKSYMSTDLLLKTKVTQKRWFANKLHGRLLVHGVASACLL